MACEELKAKLATLQQQRKETEAELHKLPPDAPAKEKAELLKQIKQLGAAIQLAQQKLDECLHAPIHVASPRNILEIQYENPAVPTGANWVASGGKAYPEDRDLEWTQVLDSGDEYDQFALVGASGWITAKEESGSDVPFSHPFGFDWEFAVVLDDRFASLVSPANGKTSGAAAEIAAANTLLKPQNVTVPPNGLLGVEWDKGLLPTSYRNQVQPGDRVAIFGRWILDQGHDVSGEYRTEIHPPLLVANASIQKDAQGNSSTRVVFMSRPYLPAQRYTLDLSDAYKDGAEDDGPFFQHLIKECAKVAGILGIPLSTQVEAHPKIKSFPFRGAHLLRIIVRPPALGPHELLIPHRLALSFHFTVRTGIAVQVTSTAPDTIEVFVSLNHAGYTPPPLPKRTDHTYSRDELDALSNGSGVKILELEAIVTGIGVLEGGGPINTAKIIAVLSLGIKTDDYEPLPERNVLDPAKAAHVFANAIPAGAGVTTDDAQPYPVFGWLEAKWVDPDIKLG